MINLLADRGVNVSPVPSSEKTESLKKSLPNDVYNRLFENIYSQFDGFADRDFEEKSFLRIWTIDDVLSSPHKTEEFVPFIDFSLNTEIYGLRSGYGTKIFSKFSNFETSVHIDEFLIRLVNGDFDETLGLP